jgi:membrane protease YdiL (CAAX protease family)
MSASDLRTTEPSARARLPVGLWLYIALACGLSWAWMVPIAVGGATVEPGRGWPTHVVALLGPMLAALLVTARFGGLRDLLHRVARVRVTPVWWLVALSPLALLGVGLLAEVVAGEPLPRSADFGVVSGLPAAWGPLLVGLVLVVVNGFGEETGWRGYALPALQSRFGPLTSMVLLALVWGAWHGPMFVVLGSFRGFDVGTLVGWALGLLAGSIVLGWLVNRTGSVAIVAVWHGLFNVASATAAASGLMAATVSAGVMVWAVVLVVLHLLSQRRGLPSALAPPTIR